MAAPSKVSLKLLVNRKTKEVLFAEAGKETVDFLCSILTLPVGMVINLLSEQGMVGCLENLHKSIESLNDDYIQPNQHKDTVLKPHGVDLYGINSHVLQFLTDAPKEEIKFYQCGNQYNHNYVGDKSGSTCPSCGCAMNYAVKLVKGNATREVAGGGSGSGSEGGGLVKGVVTYMVMDDLSVAPMSTITGITLLNKFNVTDVGDLEEKVVDLDMPKALKILKTSFQSKNVLSTVFL